MATYVNAYEQKMVMKRENIANKGIWTAKKRYILMRLDPCTSSTPEHLILPVRSQSAQTL